MKNIIKNLLHICFAVQVVIFAPAQGMMSKFARSQQNVVKSSLARSRAYPAQRTSSSAANSNANIRIEPAQAHSVVNSITSEPLVASRHDAVIVQPTTVSGSIMHYCKAYVARIFGAETVQVASVEAVKTTKAETTQAIDSEPIKLVEDNDPWHAKVPFTWIKDLHAVVKREELCVINGLIWWEQDVVKDMCKNGNKNDATIKLIHNIFYLEPNGVSFKPTIYGGKPAAYFTPELIGEMIAAITRYRDAVVSNGQNVNNAETLLHNTLCDSISKKIMSAKDALESEISPLYNTFDQLISEENKLKAELTALNKVKAPKDVVAGQLTAVVQEKGKIKKQISEQLEKLQEDEGGKHKIEKMKNFSYAMKNIKEIVTHIVESVKESMPVESPHYVAYATEQVLLALLWAKVNEHKKSKKLENDLVLFFSQISEWVDKNALNQWLSAQSYSKKEYDDFIESFAGIDSYSFQVSPILKNNIEKTVHSVMGHKALKQLFPPIARYARVMYKHDTKSTKEFPDCVETSLRNFFNIVLYESKNSLFNIDRFLAHAEKDSGEIKLQLLDSFVDFYTNNPGSDSAREQKVHDAWTAVVEDLSGVDYKNPAESKEHFYEIRSCLSGVLKVINHLIFGNNSAFDALKNNEKLDLICKKLSHGSCSVSWHTRDNINNDFVELVFCVDDSSFRWWIKNGSSVIQLNDMNESYPRVNSFMSDAGKKNDDNVHATKNYNLIQLLGRETNGEADTNQVMRNIIDTGAQHLYCYVRDKFSSLSGHNRKFVMQLIIERGRGELYSFIKEQLPLLHNDEYIRDIIGTILNAKEQRFYGDIAGIFSLIDAKKGHDVSIAAQLILLSAEKDILPYDHAIEILHSMVKNRWLADYCVLPLLIRFTAKDARWYDFIEKQLPLIQNSRNIIGAILDYKAEGFYEFVREQLPLQEDRMPFLMKIIVEKIEQFYGYVLENLSSTSSQEYATTIIAKILQEQSGLLYDLIKETPHYEHAMLRIIPREHHTLSRFEYDAMVKFIKDCKNQDTANVALRAYAQRNSNRYPICLKDVGNPQGWAMRSILDDKDLCKQLSLVIDKDLFARVGTKELCIELLKEFPELLPQYAPWMSYSYRELEWYPDLLKAIFTLDSSYVLQLITNVLASLREGRISFRLADVYVYGEGWHCALNEELMPAYDVLVSAGFAATLSPDFAVLLLTMYEQDAEFTSEILKKHIDRPVAEFIASLVELGHNTKHTIPKNRLRGFVWVGNRGNRE